MLINLKKKLFISVIAVGLLSTQLLADFHVMLNNKQQGPFSIAQIKQMKSDGSITSNSLVWQAGMDDWGKAAAQSELQSIFSAPPPPPPSASGSMPPPAPLSSQDNSTISQNDVNSQNFISDPKSVPAPDASDSVEDWSDKVLQKFGRDSFGEENGKYMIFAQQSVSLKPNDPQYGDSVINAYDKAMMKVQEQYVMNRFGKITTDKIKSLYMNRSTNAKELELPKATNPSFWKKVLMVLDKSLDVKEKELDAKLIKMGVHAGELKKITPKIKKDLFREKFLKTTMQKASGSMAGLFPVQTTMFRDSTGKTVIGIVAIASPKTLQIAKDIGLQRKSVIKGKGRDINSLLPSSNREYLSTMGIRLAYDLDGSPAIISYGMASYRPDTGDDYINDELRSEAKNAAIANADAQIAEMVNGRMNVKNERKNGEETRKFVEREVKFDSETIEKTVKNIIKTVNNSVKSSASVKLQGISTVKRWRYTSKKTGLRFVGAVRVWKYSTLKSVKSFNKPKSSKGKKKAYNHFEQESKSVNTMDDF